MSVRPRSTRWFLSEGWRPGLVVCGLVLAAGCAGSRSPEGGVAEPPEAVSTDEPIRRPDPKRLTAATAAECEAFGDHMVELMMGELDERLHEEMRPQAEAQRPELVAGCMKDGSSEEVACVLEVDDLSEVELCRAGAAEMLPPERGAGTAAGSPSEVDAATCEKFAKHMGGLTRRAILEDAGANEGNPEVLARAEAAAQQVEEDLLSICLERGTLPEVQCALSARSLAEVDRCGR